MIFLFPNTAPEYRCVFALQAEVPVNYGSIPCMFRDFIIPLPFTLSQVQLRFLSLDAVDPFPRHTGVTMCADRLLP